MVMMRFFIVKPPLWGCIKQEYALSVSIIPYFMGFCKWIEKILSMLERMREETFKFGFIGELATTLISLPQRGRGTAKRWMRRAFVDQRIGCITNFPTAFRVYENPENLIVSTFLYCICRYVVERLLYTRKADLHPLSSSVTR